MPENIKNIPPPPTGSAVKIQQQNIPPINVPPPPSGKAVSMNTLGQLSGGARSQEHINDRYFSYKDKIDALTFSGGVNEDEKSYLEDIVLGGHDDKTITDAIQTVAGEHKNQEGFQTWYKSPETGLPIPLKPGQKAPKGLQVESVWGDQSSSDDDNPLTTFGKNVANAVPGFIGAFEDVGAVIQSSVTGKEPDWYEEGKQRLEALKAKTSTASQEEIFNTQGVKSFTDLLDTDRFHFTAQNVAGTIGQATGSILEFMGANALTGGFASVGEGATIGAKVGLKAKQLAAGMTINMGEAIEMADEAGLKDREKFMFGALYALPASLIEMQLGIGASLLGKTAEQVEKKAIIKSALALLERNEAGNLTKEGIDAAYKEITSLSASYAKGVAKKYAGAAASEGTEEVAQAMIKNGSAQIYDGLFGEGKDVGEGKFGKEMLSPESFGEYINDAIGGILAGGGSDIVMKNKEQAVGAYEAVKKDGGVGLKAELSSALKKGTITPDEHALAVQKIDAYKTYDKEISDAKVKLTPEENKRVLDLSFSNENLNTQIANLKEQVKKSPDGPAAEILAATQDILNKNKAEVKEIFKKSVAVQQTDVSAKTKEEILGAGKAEKKPAAPKAAETPKPKSDATAKMAAKIASNEVKKSNGESQSNKETIATAEKESKIEPKTDVQSNKKADIEKEREEAHDQVESFGIKGSGHKTNKDAHTYIDKMYDDKLKALENEKTAELPKETVPAKTEKVEPVKSETKVEKDSKKNPVIDEGLTDEVKDEMVLQAPHQKVVEKLSKVKSKSTVAKVISRGKAYNNQLAVELKIGKENVIVPIASSSDSVGKHNKVHDFIGKGVTVKLVPKAEWNADSSKNDAYGNVYGDRLDVISKDKKVIGTLQVTDHKAEEKKLAEKKPVVETTTKKKDVPLQTEKTEADKKKEMLDSNEAKMPKERIASIAERIAKRAVEEQQKLTAKKEAKAADPNNPVKQGGPISDEDVMIAFWKLVEKVALGAISIQDAIKNLRKGLKDSSMSSTAKLNLETELVKETKEALAEIDAIEKDKNLTPEEREKKQLAVANDYTKKVTSSFGQDRALELKNKVREIYTGVPGFKNDEEIEKMLVEISHHEVAFDQDFDKSLADLREEGEKEGSEQKMNLALHLNDKSEKQLIQLFNVFRNTEYQPYIKIQNTTGKSLDYSLSNSQYENDLIDKVTESVSSISENEYGKLHDEIEYKKLFKYSLQNEKELVDYLVKVTGLSKVNWERYLSAKSFKDREAAYVRLYNQTVYGAKNFNLEKPSTKEIFLKNIGASKKGKGSPVNTIALNTPFNEIIKSNIVTKFKNVSWDSKSSSDLTTHLSNMMNRVLGPEYDSNNNAYSDNAWVQAQRKNGVAPKVIYFDGIYKNQDKNATSGDMVAEDIRKAIIVNYQSNQLGPNEYLQNVGQFGDKDKMAFVPAKRYKTIAEAQAKYEKILTAAGVTDTQKVIDSILADGRDNFEGILNNGSEADADLFSLNYAINFNEINDFLNGMQGQYAKKGKQAWVDLFKRGGSTASPGISLNKYVEGGVGESHKLIVINKPITSVQDKKDFALSDGQEFISREYSDMVNKSSGGMFDTIIKAITSYTEPTGKRVLIKTNAIVIDDLVTMFPDNSAYKAIKALMVNGVHRIVTEDGAKYKGDAETVKIFKAGSYDIVPHTVSDKNILTVKTEDYLIQQDLVHDGKLSQGSTPIQRIKNMLKAKTAESTTRLYNKLGKDQINKLRDELTSLEPKQFRNYLLSKLKYSEAEIKELMKETTDTLAEEENVSSADVDYIEKLLTDGTSLSHPHLHKWLQTFVANIVTKEALGRITNKGLFVEMGHMPSKDFILNDMKVVDGKVQLPEIAISELSGLKVGEYVMVTRIPADDMHSHTLAKVKYLLPASMKNVIITNSESQYISGSDFDGDQRTVEGLFKDKKGNVIEDDSIKGIANKAFKKDMEWFLDPKNVKNATTPIDTGFADTILAKLPQGKEKENDSPETFTQARINNKVGLAVVGNMANLQAVYDYLKKHKSFLKRELSFPKLRFVDNKIVKSSNIEFGEFKNDDDIKAVIGNLLNLALDNVKDPKIEKLGLNEVTTNMYVMALSQGVDMESVVAFFNSPVVKEYVARVRKTKSTDSIESEFDVMREMVIEFEPGAAMEKNPLVALPEVPSVTTKNINDPQSLDVLSLLNTLNKASKDFNKIHNVIKSTENAKKSWADYKYGNDVYNQIINNQLDYIDTETFKGSPYIELAAESLAVSEVFLEKQAPEFTNLGKDITAAIYKSIQSDWKDAKAKNFSKKQLEDISKAIHSIVLNNSRGRNEDFKVWSQKFALKISNLTAEGKYPDIMNALEIVDDKVYDKVWDDKDHKFRSELIPGIKKVSLRQDFKQSMPEGEVIKFQKALTELSKTGDGRDLLQELVDYSAFQYNLAVSKFGGSYASLFTKPIHLQIGAAIDIELKKWDDLEYMKDNSASFVHSIQENNPSINPAFKTDIKKQMGNEKGRPIYQPNIKKEIGITINAKALDEITSGVRNQFSIDQTKKTENAAVAFKIKAGTQLSLKVEGKKEVVIKEVDSVGKTKEGFILVKLKVPQQQKESSEPANDKLQKVIDKVQKSFPKVKVVYDKNLQAAGELSADGKTVSINPGYAGLDTPIHEYGHVLIDAMGGISNSIIARGIEQLKESELWKETEAKYPELSQEMLAKEVLAEAIGREGKELFKESEKQSKFISWLSSLFFRLGVKLGIQKNIAKNLASQILSGKDLGLETVAGKEKQQQKESEKEEDDEFVPPTEEELRAEHVEKLKASAIKDWRTYAQKIATSVGEIYNPTAISNELKSLKEKLELAETKEAKEEVQDQIDLLQSRDEEYKKGFVKYQEDLEKALKEYSTVDLKTQSIGQLQEYYFRMKSMDVLATSDIIDDIKSNIANKLGQLGVEFLKDKDSSYNEETTSKEDIKLHQKWMLALSDMSEKYPEMQELARIYSNAITNSVEQRGSLVKEILDVEKKLIKEYNEKNGIKGLIKDYLDPLADNTKYYSFLTDKDGNLVTKKSPEYITLTETQKKFVSIYSARKSQFAGLSGVRIFGDNGLIKVEKTFAENYKKGDYGILEAYMHYTGNVGRNEDNAILKYKNKDGKEEFLTFKEIKSRIAANVGKGILTQIAGIYQTTKYKLRAKDVVNKKVHENTEKYQVADRGEYGIENGKIISKFNAPYSKDKDFSMDHGRALKEFVSDMVFIDNMKEVVPVVESLEYMNQFSDNKRPHLAAWLDIWKKGNILKEVMPSLGGKYDEAIRFLRVWTQLRVMAFNIPAGIMNVFIGKYNQFRGQSVKYMTTGEKRFWNNWKKAQALDKHLQIVSIQGSENPAPHISKLFDNLAFGMTKMGENYIQLSAVIGQIEDEQWDWIDKEGKITGKNQAEITARTKSLKNNIAKYKKNVADIQGKYSENEKRNFSHFEVGRAIGQFKVWMPDAFKDRFAKEYTDIHGDKRQGTLNHLISKASLDMIRQLNNKDGWKKLMTGTDKDSVLFRRNLRSAMFMLPFLIVWLGGSDDDDDTVMAQQLTKMLGDMSFVFNISQGEFITQNPVAALSTAHDMFKTLHSVVQLQEYKNNSKSHEKGDFKFTNEVQGMTPYKNIWKVADQIVEQ